MEKEAEKRQFTLTLRGCKACIDFHSIDIKKNNENSVFKLTCSEMILRNFSEIWQLFGPAKMVYTGGSALTFSQTGLRAKIKADIRTWPVFSPPEQVVVSTRRLTLEILVQNYMLSSFVYHWTGWSRHYAHAETSWMSRLDQSTGYQ